VNNKQRRQLYRVIQKSPSFLPIIGLLLHSMIRPIGIILSVCLSVCH